MKAIETTIFVTPTAKARVRIVTLRKGKNAGKVIAYTPRKTAKAEAEIRRHLVDLLVRFDADVPLRLSLTFWLARPKSAPKDREYPVVKPDIDNLYKLLADSTQGIIPDDAQITNVSMCKRYCLPGQVPRIDIYLREEK